MTTTNHKANQPTGPTSPGATAVAGGGTFAAVQQFYKITALIAGKGESAPSAEVNATPAVNGHIDLTWTCPAGTNGVRIYRGTATNAEGTLVAVLPGSPGAFTDTNLNAGAASPPAVASAGATAKTGTGIPTKANIPAGIPAGLALTFYAALCGWVTGPNGGTVQTRNQEYANAAGFVISEV